MIDFIIIIIVEFVIINQLNYILISFNIPKVQWQVYMHVNIIFKDILQRSESKQIFKKVFHIFGYILKFNEENKIFNCNETNANTIMLILLN